MRTIDRPLLYATGLLFIGGLLILFSASMASAEENFGSISYYVLRQLVYGGGAGLLALLITQWIPYRTWKSLALPLMACAFIILALVFIPELSYATRGARRWLEFGIIRFQPSEFLKLAFIIYLASWLDARRKEVATVSYGTIPFGLMLSVVGIFLIMQPDLGTLGVIIGTSGILYFLGGGAKAQIAALFIFGLALFYLVIQIAPYQYQLDRLRVFLSPGLDPQGTGYQITQALIAIGSGGFWGLGFGESLQKYRYLPEPMSDSIFAIVAEELGFIGAVVLIGFFVFFFWRGLVIARRAPDVFGKLLGAGIAVGIVSQAFINMAALTGLLPLTGIPLPLVSYGGTSLMVTLASIGILLNISKHARVGA